MSPTDAAQALGVSKWTIYRACASGALRASKPTGPRGRWLIDGGDLLAWVEHGVVAHDEATPARRLAGAASTLAGPARQRLTELRAGSAGSDRV